VAATLRRLSFSVPGGFPKPQDKRGGLRTCLRWWNGWAVVSCGSRPRTICCHFLLPART